MPHEYESAGARRWALIGFAAAAALPALSWHELITRMAAEFRLDPGYLIAGWGGFFLIGAGLLCFLPVLVSAGRSPESRLYPRNRNALTAWGVSLYLMGLGLAIQVSQIAGGLSAA